MLVAAPAWSSRGARPALRQADMGDSAVRGICLRGVRTGRAARRQSIYLSIYLYVSILYRSIARHPQPTNRPPPPRTRHAESRCLASRGLYVSQLLAYSKISPIFRRDARMKDCRGKDFAKTRPRKAPFCPPCPASHHYTARKERGERLTPQPPSHRQIAIIAKLIWVTR